VAAGWHRKCDQFFHRSRAEAGIWISLWRGSGDWRVVGCTDINTDGKADLIFQNHAGQIYVWLLDGTGSAVNFSSNAGLTPGSGYLYGAGSGLEGDGVPADINSDGVPDLIFQNTAGQIYAWVLDGTAEPQIFPPVAD